MCFVLNVQVPSNSMKEALLAKLKHPQVAMKLLGLWKPKVSHRLICKLLFTPCIVKSNIKEYRQ